MSFSQSSINQVRVQSVGPELYIAWDSTAPSGTIYQVYVGQRLAWYGFACSCYVPIPSGAVGTNVWIDVGTVDSTETRTDFSTSLASLSRGAGIVELTWVGGTYLDPSGLDDIRGFHVYRSAGPNSPLDLSSAIGDVSAYPGGWISDGFGMGGFGQGGFGRSASIYLWSEASLASGTWTFRIVPYDMSGTERGTGQEVSVHVNAAPRPPALSPSGNRLNMTYSGQSTRVLSLSWLPSPSV